MNDRRLWLIGRNRPAARLIRSTSSIELLDPTSENPYRRIATTVLSGRGWRRSGQIPSTGRRCRLSCWLVSRALQSRLRAARATMQAVRLRNSQALQAVARRQDRQPRLGSAGTGKRKRPRIRIGLLIERTLSSAKPMTSSANRVRARLEAAPLIACLLYHLQGRPDSRPPIKPAPRNPRIAS